MIFIWQRGVDTALNTKKVTGDSELPLSFTATGHSFSVMRAMWRGFDMTGIVKLKVKLKLEEIVVGQ